MGNLLIAGKKAGEEYEFSDFVARLEKFWVYYRKAREQPEDARTRYDEGFNVEQTKLLKEMFEMWRKRRGGYAK